LKLTKSARPGNRAGLLHVARAGGRKRETFAKAEGCAAIRIHGRRGWAREFPDYRLTRILLEKNLT
jgi:hypothetical protein